VLVADERREKFMDRCRKVQRFNLGPPLAPTALVNTLTAAFSCGAAVLPCVSFAVGAFAKFNFNGFGGSSSGSSPWSLSGTGEGAGLPLVNLAPPRVGVVSTRLSTVRFRRSDLKSICGLQASVGEKSGCSIGRRDCGLTRDDVGSEES
jgi:hypothetical protein